MSTKTRLRFCGGRGFMTLMSIKTANDKTIAEAAALIRAGRLVALPTETVYGLGADATNGDAVVKIFAAKDRPSFNPLIVHVADSAEAAAIVEMDARAREVAEAFWPGPLTLILPRRSPPTSPPHAGGIKGGVSELCSAGLPTQAVRVPAHPVMRAVIEAAGVPIAAPSANRSGEVSPTTPLLVAESLGERVDMILAAGPCEVGLESTVLDLSGPAPFILRPGAITAEDIAAVLECDVAYDLGEGAETPKSPGQLLRHYAPSLPVRLNAVDMEEGEALLAFGSLKFMGLKTGGFAKDLPDYAIRNLSENGDLHEAAANLFRMLHELDNPKNKGIAVMAIPDTDLGLAINDRLRRAAQGRA